MKSRIRMISCAAVIAAALLAGGCAMQETTGEKTVQGNAALEEGDYKEAQELFREALSDGEQRFLACRGLGMAYMGLGDYENAETAFEEALDAADARMPSNTEDVQLYLATVQYRQEEYEDVIATCTDLLDESDEGDADAYFLRGSARLCEGETDAASEDFDAAIELSPEDYDLYLNIYESYAKENLSGMGVSYLQAALDLKGMDTDYYYNQGRVYYYLENYDQAQQMLIGPVEEGYEPAMFLIGKVYLAQDDRTHALAIYEQIQKQFGDSTECFNGLAMCAIQSGDYDKAIDYISQGLALDETEGKQELYFNEIVAYEKKLDFETAKAKAREYIDRYPTDEAGKQEWAFLSTR